MDTAALWHFGPRMPILCIQLPWLMSDKIYRSQSERGYRIRRCRWDRKRAAVPCREQQQKWEERAQRVPVDTHDKGRYQPQTASVTGEPASRRNPVTGEAR